MIGQVSVVVYEARRLNPAAAVSVQSAGEQIPLADRD
jgi:hypothetical protein